jgi:cephalosporin hydroxylase
VYAVQDVIDEFHRVYYDERARTWLNTNWLGWPTQKCPLDLWQYQQIIIDTRPTLVVETGTCQGGSALFLASVFDHVGFGRVITIDIDGQPERPMHPRITYVHGSSSDAGVVERVRRAADKERTMVVLDSDHTYAHVLAELRSYAPLVARDCYLIVEDTNLNGNPVLPDFGPGPREAVLEFLASSGDFHVDESREQFFMTFNPGGYLLRVGR